jgi:putative oxidoreductase
MSLMAALLHVLIIFGGAPWYRFFGAGETMAGMAEAGSPVPGLVTGAIAALLATWGRRRTPSEPRRSGHS